ncbi:undecaprenyl-phosphate alpha-N-acetylglucosaminyl 1-phosphate transferase [Pseudolysinimonas yzui]|uniref:Undecaprenyl-phosphate alpha-N-acetylglucosaminyl 1-phosphate transferase n=1 Tax=Pseudolysinimonas yzui TaxID=2708254 RepID=A0A8J3GNE9_9MICO|nr:undecaprenyl-phosphate alpha-N-acetylglucosaminyl 1-phosphate transferase [Pseudolysinimonas yzui]
MRIIFYVLVALVSGVVSFGASWAIWKLSHKYRLYPKIRARDVHTRPTPRLGGIALFLGIVIAFAVGSQLPPLALIFNQPQQVLAVLGAALLIVLIGVADDIWDLDWFTKLAGQIMAAGLLAWQGVQIGWVPLPGTVAPLSPYMSLLVTIFAIVLVMNAVNFIDGLDGLVAGVATVASAAFFVYGYIVSYGPTEQSDYFNLAQFITAALIGACLGFLPWNWRRGDDRPARLFMGDGGALLVGLLMATSTVALAGQTVPTSASEGLVALIPVILPLAVLIVPLADFTLAVLRRLRAGKSPFSADRNHLHHRLLDMGHSHVHAVVIFYAWTAAASVGMLLFLIPGRGLLIGGIVMLVGFVVCTIVTLAPLSRRKAIEAAVQSAPADLAADAGVAEFDPLDAAAGASAVGVEHTDAEAARALERLHEKEASA